jgi:hypothetical protein
VYFINALMRIKLQWWNGWIEKISESEVCVYPKTKVEP